MSEGRVGGRRDVSRTAGQPVRSRIPGPKLRFGAEEEERSLSGNVKLSELREFAPVIHATSWSEVPIAQYVQPEVIKYCCEGATYSARPATLVGGTEVDSVSSSAAMLP